MKRVARAKRPAPGVAAKKEAEQQQLYREMVRAVRAWLAVAHPKPLSDRVDVCLFDDVLGGESVAWFHVDANNPYVRGDLMAMEGK
ncbi:unnamed protein product [Gemmataceae bacterium]|nr:unnamed protein product [Gemmataceae bacterium]VTT99000.1 unnamed protein product [Gemmataceae bacterium]